jgi:hypothetical protein
MHRAKITFIQVTLRTPYFGNFVGLVTAGSDVFSKKAIHCRMAAADFFCDGSYDPPHCKKSKARVPPKPGNDAVAI